MDTSIEISKYILLEDHALLTLDRHEIMCAIEILYEAIKHQKTIYSFGNGGSASTASHFANDFNKILNGKLSNKFTFICLNDNIPTIMAIANDIDYSEIFTFQLENRVKPGDVVIAISGSGNSSNVIYGAVEAKAQGASVIALTGYDGGKLKDLADVHLHVPIDDMQITEDLHLMYNHLIVSVISKLLKFDFLKKE